MFSSFCLLPHDYTAKAHQLGLFRYFHLTACLDQWFRILKSDNLTLFLKCMPGWFAIGQVPGFVGITVMYPSIF